MENSLKTDETIWLYGYAGKGVRLELEAQDTLQIHSLVFDTHDTAIKVWKLISKELTDNQISHRVSQCLEENGTCYLHVEIYSSGVHKQVMGILATRASQYFIDGDTGMPEVTARYSLEE